jgi:hypothetical protein
MMSYGREVEVGAAEESSGIPTPSSHRSDSVSPSHRTARRRIPPRTIRAGRAVAGSSVASRHSAPRGAVARSQPGLAMDLRRGDRETNSRSCTRRSWATLSFARVRRYYCCASGGTVRRVHVEGYWNFVDCGLRGCRAVSWRWNRMRERATGGCVEAASSSICGLCS